MNESQAIQLAGIVGGDAEQSGGGVWLVTVIKANGHLVVFGDSCVGEYESEEKFDDGEPISFIDLV